MKNVRSHTGVLLAAGMVALIAACSGTPADDLADPNANAEADTDLLALVMLSGRDLYPITHGLSTWLGYADRQPVLYQLTISGAFIAIIPLIALTLSLQRFWLGGLTEGSVKG